MKSRAAIALLVAFCLAPAAWAQVFKWVDESGKTHYGERPPPGVKAVEIGVPAPPSGAAAVPAPQKSAKEEELEFRKRQIERAKQEAKGEASAEEQRHRADRCALAQRRLTALQEPIRVFDRNEKGERVYIDDAARPAAIATEQRKIAENCR
jgi:hypothetical protein